MFSKKRGDTINMINLIKKKNSANNIFLEIKNKTTV